MGPIGQLIQKVRFFRAGVMIAALSAQNRLKSIGKEDKVHWQEGYEHQPILFLALFQKGKLRDDTLTLLKAAKARGMYVIAVNSMKLEKAHHPRDLIDCYVERYNFGRDFGSYKSGMLRILKDDGFSQCPRLLMMNDSVFVCSDRIEAFLRDLVETEHDVLGATENYEIEYHIGSFCISMSQRILAHPKFRKYWENYRNSDMRPVVIKRGEMGLSKVLKSCATAQESLRALYDSVAFHDRCLEDDAFLDEVVAKARASDLTGWKRLSVRDVVEDYSDMYLRPTYDGEKISIETTVGADAPMREIRMTTLADADAYFDEVIASGADERTKRHFRDFVAAQATDVFMSGSQIHQNASILVHMGLAIVKLDGLYRGMFTVSDLDRILEMLTPEDARQLKYQIFRRPYGGDTLRGWKRDAFFVGLI